MPDFVTLAAALQVCLIPAAVIAWATPPAIPIIDRSVDRDASGSAPAAQAVTRVERGQGADGEASVAAVTDVGIVDRVASPSRSPRYRADWPGPCPARSPREPRRISGRRCRARARGCRVGRFPSGDRFVQDCLLHFRPSAISSFPDGMHGSPGLEHAVPLGT